MVLVYTVRYLKNLRCYQIISNRDKDRVLEWNFVISMQGLVTLCLLRRCRKYLARTLL